MYKYYIGDSKEYIIVDGRDVLDVPKSMEMYKYMNVAELETFCFLNNLKMRIELIDT